MIDLKVNNFQSTSQSDFASKYSDDPNFQFTPRKTLSALAAEKQKKIELAERERRIQEEIARQQRELEQDLQSSRASSTRNIPEQPPQVAKRAVDPYRHKTSAEKERIRKEIEETRGQIMKYRVEQKNRQSVRNKENLKELDRPEVYDPFGKPGAGAPLTGDNKKKKFTESELHKFNAEKQSRPNSVKSFSDRFGQPGAGAPRRTDSGKPITQVRGDGSIRFGQKDNRERYKQDSTAIRSYADVLNQQIKERHMNEKMKKQEELQQEQDMLKTDFYGKPGGGAPRKTASGNLFTGRTMKDESSLQHKKENVNQVYDPWGKGVGAPVRQGNGRIMNRRGLLSNEVRLSKQTARQTDTSNDNSMQFSPRVKSRPYYEDVQIYDPFGKGGAGAPVRDTTGKLVTARSKNVASFSTDVTSADIRRRKRAANEYMQEQKVQLEEKATERTLANKFGKEFSGREFASLMKESTVGHPRRDPKTGLITGEKLRSSDITQATVQPKHYTSNAYSRDYYDELTRDAEERSRRRQLEKMKEKQEDLQHGAAFETFWGKPGAGAPRDPFNKKVNLDKALTTPRNQEVQSYSKIPNELSTGVNQKQKFVKSTTKSSSSNNFEISPNSKINVNYKPSLPYASYDE